MIEHERALSSSFLSENRHAHTHSGSSNESFTPSTCSCERFSSFCSRFFLHAFLAAFFHFFLHLKFVDYNLLFSPHKEGMDLSDEYYLSTAYEPNAYDFKEISVEFYTELLDSPPLFSNKVCSADPDYDDAALEDMFHQAHRAQAYHSLQEDLSVTLSSSSMSDRTDPLEIERGDPLSNETRKRILGFCSTNNKSKLLQSAKQELTNTNFNPLTTGSSTTRSSTSSCTVITAKFGIT